MHDSVREEGILYCPDQLSDPSPYEGGSVGVLVLKTAVKAGCLGAVEPAQESGEPKPAALRSEITPKRLPYLFGAEE
jgi:hypothetical protein